MNVLAQVQRQQGQALFVLVAILGILGAIFAMSFINSSDSTRSLTTTTAALAEARNALIGYAASRPGATPFLPCPDTDNDGVENRVAGACTAPGGLQAEGILPWATLGVTGVDAWGHRFRYSVTRARAADPALTGNATDGIHVASAGTINIRDSSTLPATLLAGLATAVILSHGPNGWGSTSSSGGVAPAPPAINVAERDNTTSNNEFRANPYTDLTATPGGRFDDIVTWLTANDLRTQLTAAGNPAPP